MKKVTKALLLAVLGTAATGAAQAQTATTTFQVTATVSASCSVTATDLAFGPYLATAGAALDASSTISVTCSNSHPYDVSVGATPATRTMAGPAGSTLNYGMFNEAARTSAFGVTGATGSGAAQAYTVYGRVPAGQFLARPGAHSDTVTVTVTY
jgi:spore coat protein U-like protein